MVQIAQPPQPPKPPKSRLEGYRKLIIWGSGLLATTFLCGFGFLEGPHYTAAISALAVVVVGGNITEHLKKKD